MPIKLVIDASALVKYLLHEEGWTNVRTLFDQAIEGSFELHSVDLVLKEVGSALQRYVSSGSSREVTSKIYHQLLSQTIISYHRQDASILGGAFDLALQNELSIYDAVYLVLARNLRAELVTSDGRQAAVAKAIMKVHEVR